MSRHGLDTHSHHLTRLAEWSLADQRRSRWAWPLVLRLRLATVKCRGHETSVSGAES